jgi:hypothetical protein
MFGSTLYLKLKHLFHNITVTEVKDEYCLGNFSVKKNSYNTGHNGPPKHMSPKSFVVGTVALSSHLPQGLLLHT